MVTTLLMSRTLARMPGGATRVLAVVGRNVAASRHAVYVLVLLGGFVEPVLYLLSIGVGVGKLVGTVELAPGRVVSYAAFVAPAMLAASAMNGAVAETAMNFFGKMKYAKLYESVIATPVAPLEVALGEMLWGLARGGGYSAVFLGIMAGAGITSPLRALAAFPATVLVGLAFSGLGLALATLLRDWQDFDYVSLLTSAMFLFSGTFVPTTGYPALMRAVVAVTPLYHSVQLVRGVTVGSAGWGVWASAGYLLALAALTFLVAARRTKKMLIH